MLDSAVLLGEALAARVDVTEVFVDPDRLDAPSSQIVSRAEDAGAQVFHVSSDVFGRVTDPVHPQAVAAIARRPHNTGVQLTKATSVLVMIEVRDPGNAGTLMRSALAAGCDAVVATSGTVEMFGPKTLRASAGAVLHLPVVAGGDPVESIAKLQDAGFTTFATSSYATAAYDEVNLTGRCALIVGNEAHGIEQAVLDAVDQVIQIPMAAPVESLNVAMAGTVLCFEMMRQRRQIRGV